MIRESDPRSTTPGAIRVPIDRTILAILSSGRADVEQEFLNLFRRINDEDVAMLLRAVMAGELIGDRQQLFYV